MNTFWECLIWRWAQSASQWQLHGIILCFRADPLCSSHMQLWMGGCSFAQHSSSVHWNDVLTALFGCYVAVATWNCCHLNTCSVLCHFSWNHIRRVRVCLAMTCHLHFWQNGQDVLRATMVTWGWNGYQNKSAWKVDPGEENTPAAPDRNQTHNLLITGPVLYHWDIPTPQYKQSVIIILDRCLSLHQCCMTALVPHCIC